jgi:FKBP-type peptidyl-prolyl cis-trans isomerase
MRNAWMVASLGGLIGAGIAVLADMGAGGQGGQPPPVSGQSNYAPSGLEYIDVAIGSGPAARPGMRASVHYTGWLRDGTKFDSSVDRRQPFQFTLGARQVISGWDEGVAGMRVGGKRRLIVPPDLGYGARGAGGVIPPNATLIFDVELLGVE